MHLAQWTFKSGVLVGLLLWHFDYIWMLFLNWNVALGTNRRSRSKWSRWQFSHFDNRVKITGRKWVEFRGASRGERRGDYSPPKPKKCCRKMVLFSRGVKNDKRPGRWDRKRIKSQFSIEIFICKFQNFLNQFQSPLVFSTNAQIFDASFLNFF